MKTWFSLIFYLAITFGTFSQIDASAIARKCDSLFRIGIEEKEFPGLTVSYFSKDTSWNASYGVRKWGETGMVDTNSLFQLGSIGKILTAISVLQLVESDRLNLEEDISSYIALELDRYDSSAITLKSLLTHSAGMNDRNIGYFAKDASSTISLEDHLIKNLPSFFQSSGIEINYSNYSYALAGLIVESVSGLPFQDYVDQHILRKLGMDDSFVGFDFGYYQNPKYAIGHVKSDGGFEANQEYARHATPAGSFISSANDMSKLLKAMQERDTLLLDSDSWELMFSRQFSNDTQLSGYSIGLEEQDMNGKRYWAKGGMLSGYLSQVVFWPDSSAMFIAVNTNSDEFLERFHSEMRGYLLDQPEFHLLPVLNTNLSEYAGEYRNARYDRNGIENIISLFKGAFYVWEGDSCLMAWHNGEMQKYNFIGNQTFQNQINPDENMVFVRQNDRVVKLYRNVNIGGLIVPSTFEKTKWYNSPSFINEYYGIVPLGIGLYGIISLSGILILLLKGTRSSISRKLLSRFQYSVAFVGTLLVCIHILKVFLPMVISPMNLLFGLSDSFVLYNQIALLIIATTVILIVLLVRTILLKNGTWVRRVIFGIFTLLMCIHSWFLAYWNFA